MDDTNKIRKIAMAIAQAATISSPPAPKIGTRSLSIVGSSRRCNALQCRDLSAQYMLLPSNCVSFSSQYDHAPLTNTALCDFAHLSIRPSSSLDVLS